MSRIGMVLAASVCLAPLQALAANPGAAQAQRVTITRDTWGIAHIRGKTDADAVFGMIYAQAEDDFNRVETNYLTALGRTAQAEGEVAIWADLRQRLFINDEDLKAQYAKSPGWLKTLMTAWADGLNYYLATHPQVKPKVLTHFEPWMALSFTEGSIGGDIEKVSLTGLESFYGKRQVAMTEDELGLKPWEPSGSNGIAIAPSNTKDGHALLLINPHTSFYFRSEAQVTSDQGLNVYGASTWGQFFVYQGFNEKAGWMHTTSTLDSVDEFAETIVDQGGKLFYRYGKALRPVTVGKITVPYKAADGSMKSRDFTVYRTHHGPIVREADGKWVAFALMNTPIAALQQSFLRTKATDLKSFQKVAEFRANSSNNTLFADSTGQVALLMPQFVPKRDNRFDYTKPVDGSDPATDWQGLHALSEAPNVIAPANGWVANSNNWPYSAAAQFSPKIQDYPKYMDSVGENPRGLHYISLLKDRKDFTVDSLVTTAYDPYQPAFARLVPTLVTAWDKLAWDDPRKVALADQVATLRGWDNRWSTDSVAQTLAVYWGEAMWNMGAAEAKADEVTIYDWMDGRSSADQKLKALADASAKLTADFGTWKTAWGQVNRFQRLTDDIVHPFDDAKPSIPVGFASAQWGSLASYGIRSDEGTKKRYGTYGNSFVAVVEFGPRLKARAITAGGESGDPASPHFNDQAERYSKGDLREVWFYPDQVKAHTERVYKPGE